MKSILLAVIFFGSSVVCADIARPRQRPTPEPRNIVVGQIDEVAAASLYESMPGSGIRGSQLRTSRQTYKVLRASDGLDQVICLKTQYVRTNETHYRCWTETSADGSRLRPYQPTIRLG